MPKGEYSEKLFKCSSSIPSLRISVKYSKPLYFSFVQNLCYVLGFQHSSLDLADVNECLIPILENSRTIGICNGR